MQYFGFDRPSFGIKTFGFGANPDADILALFAGGKQGVWYDPSDITTLFQDVAGTVPVTKDGDPVALMRDKSGSGNHATQSVSTARPIYKTDGILHRLSFDGIDDHLLFNKNTFAADKSQAILSAYSVSNVGYEPIISGLSADAGLVQFHSGPGTKLYRRVAVITSTMSSAGNSAGVLPFKAPIVRTTNWNRSVGVATDTVNRASAFTTSTVGVNATLILPTDYQSIGRILANYTLMGFYGVVAVSDNLTPSAIENVEQYLASKSGVTL